MRNWRIAAMRAGKAVLVEKPAGMNAAEVVTLTEVAAQEGVFFMEAFMYRCHPQIARVLEVIAAGEIGDIVHIRTAFGFAASFDPASRLLRPGRWAAAASLMSAAIRCRLRG